jgi:hypothetical protein
MPQAQIMEPKRRCACSSGAPHTLENQIENRMPPAPPKSRESRPVVLAAFVFVLGFQIHPFPLPRRTGQNASPAGPKRPMGSLYSVCELFRVKTGKTERRVGGEVTLPPHRSFSKGRFIHPWMTDGFPSLFAGRLAVLPSQCRTIGIGAGSWGLNGRGEESERER